MQLIFCIIFIIGFELGPGSICWAYVSEICVEKAAGLATIANWFWTLVVGLLFPKLNGTWLPVGVVDLLFAGASGIGLIFYFIYFIETRGKTSAQIKRQFLPKDQQSKFIDSEPDEID